MATLQKVPPDAVKAFGTVDDWSSTFRIIVEERFYVVEKVYGVDDRVREVMLKGNTPLGTDDFQDRNEVAMAALVCGGKAYIGTADETRTRDMVGMDQVEQWVDGGAFLVQEHVLQRVTEVATVREGRLTRTLTESRMDGTERIVVLETPKAPRRRSPRLQEATRA